MLFSQALNVARIIFSALSTSCVMSFRVGEREVPGLGVLVEVAEGTNVGPQVYDGDMGRVFVAGIDNETEAEVSWRRSPWRFQLVFGALDGGVVHAGELAANIREQVLADFLIGMHPSQDGEC